MLINVPGLTYIIPGTLISGLAVQKPNNKQNDENQIYFQSPKSNSTTLLHSVWK